MRNKSVYSQQIAAGGPTFYIDQMHEKLSRPVSTPQSRGRYKTHREFGRFAVGDIIYLNGVKYFGADLYRGEYTVTDIWTRSDWVNVACFVLTNKDRSVEFLFDWVGVNTGSFMSMRMVRDRQQMSLRMM